MSRKGFVLMLLFDFSGAKPPRESLYLGHLKSKIQEDWLITVSETISCLQVDVVTEVCPGD